MRLLAVSDLHVRAAGNRDFIDQIPASPADWLILGGDVGEREEDLAYVLERLSPRFAKLIWVPGNHELWSTEQEALRGVARYERYVELCRKFGALTPEDPYATWPDDPKLVIAPLFLLYDYSFRPAHVSREGALDWAAETGVVCTDEFILHPDPYPSREAWCHARCDATEKRLDELPRDVETVLINHFPLKQSHAWLPRVPRFSIWCGTTRTENWHLRYRARAVVFGHLHIRQERIEDGIPFHEVSLGYPRQWDTTQPQRYVRQILPPR